MGWNNPPLPWRELADRLGDGTARSRATARREARHDDGRPRNAPPTADGGDSPAWSRRRLPYEPPPTRSAPATATPYAELHCHSNFSFLDGASHPEELAEEAARLGLAACALTDHDGLYGVVRFAEAAGTLDLRTVFGAELSIGQTRAGNGVADPDGRHLVVIARDPTGYAALARAISLAQLRGSKGRPVVEVDELGALAGDHWAVLTGCRKGTVPGALTRDGIDAAHRELEHLVDVFGRCHVKVELWDHGDPLDTARNDALSNLATRCGVDTVATNNVHYATPHRRRLAGAQAAIRARRSLDELDGWLPAAGTAHLRSGDEQAARFARYPGVLETTTALALASSFDLRLVAPRLPDFPVPAGHTEASWLRQLTLEGALRRYGPATDERVPGAHLQIERELAVITELGFPGYFLIVWDIVEFCRRSNIYCQGRGSAANSAVCYALGITKADPVDLRLLFERFLSPARDGPPDIDLDIESGRREEVIQYVYDRYGRHHTAQVANVITYRPRSAIRDAGRALGFSPGQLDRWARRLDGWGPLREVAAAVSGGNGGTHDGDGDPEAIPETVVDLAAQLEGFPRHLGIHSGGMVICDRPVIDVCPVEWATMPDRSVLQWDKDDCAAIGLVKFDLLGLGMLEVLHRTVDLIAAHQQTAIDLAHIPQEDAVYRMLSRADSIGVFQVESRAQMGTLPRLKPRKFYDLVVEVALIRPGPIQGGSVHPFIRRRNDLEEVTYLHPLLEKPLEKTLGVPLFQEQMMEIAVEVAGFTAAEADELRQAMGAKRSHQRMERLRERFYAGMAVRGITGDTADQIYDKLLAFANFGFPESHSVSFAYLVYASAWLKLHHPAAFLAALLDAQPMGFWSPQTLIADAQRHGVEVLGADVHASAATTTLEPLTPRTGEPPEHHVRESRPVPQTASPGEERPEDHTDGSSPERIPAEQLAERTGADRGLAVRLGLSQVRSIGDDLADRIAAGAPYDNLEALMRHCGPTVAQAEALATAGALAPLVGDRRRALWAAGAAARAGPDELERTATGMTAPQLTPMTLFEEVGADLWATGVSTRATPMQFVRDRLRDAGVLTAVDLDTAEPERTVTVAGVVTHRQRPATAGGITFMNLEDETGLVNVICPHRVWSRHRTVARTSPALVVHGRLERAEGVVNVVATRLEHLDLHMATSRSRDFR